jgi:hypothetical protein
MIEYRRWDTAEADELRSIAGWQSDFHSVLIASEALLELQLPKTHENMEIVEAAFSGLVIRYMRPFSSGRRPRLNTSDNQALSETDISSHDYFCSLRNRQIAHSISRRETSSAFLGIDISKSIPVVTHVSSGGCSIYCFSPEDLHRLIVLCKVWLEWIHLQHNKVCERLKIDANALSPDDLHMLPLGPREPSENPSVHRGHLDG